MCEMLDEGIRVLRAAGATCVTVACNTLQSVARDRAGRLSVPFLEIAPALFQQASLRDLKRLMLVGAESLRNDRSYCEYAGQLGITLVEPSRVEQKRINRAILDAVSDASAVAVAVELRSLLDGFGGRVDGVLVACTDLAGLLTSGSMPVLDSVDVLSARIAEHLCQRHFNV